MKKRILVVDDDWIYLELLKFRLLRRSFEVLTARNEKELWEKAFGAKLDMIIIDLLLKNNVGSNSYQNLVNFGFDPTVPVIFMSAFVNEEMMNSPAAGEKFLMYHKSSDFEELMNDINHFLNPKRKEQENGL